MTIKEVVKGLRDLLNHSCTLEGGDFGWFSCCNRRDYSGHEKRCDLVKLIKNAEKLIMAKELSDIGKRVKQGEKD